eukprot:7244541-Prymnesium_polylepis.2
MAMGEKIIAAGKGAPPAEEADLLAAEAASPQRKRKQRSLHDMAEDGASTKSLLRASKNENFDAPDPIWNLTPLMICCREGHARAAKDLIQEGADVNFENVNHWTPLMLAIDGGHEAAVKLLLAHGADVEFVGRYRYNVLHQAVYSGHAGILRLLVGECFEQLDEPSDKGFTPLHIASRYGREECVDILLQARADPTSQPEKCNLNTPLVSRGPTRIVRV